VYCRVLVESRSRQQTATAVDCSGTNSTSLCWSEIAVNFVKAVVAALREEWSWVSDTWQCDKGEGSQCCWGSESVVPSHCKQGLAELGEEWSWVSDRWQCDKGEGSQCYWGSEFVVQSQCKQVIPDSWWKSEDREWQNLCVASSGAPRNAQYRVQRPWRGRVWLVDRQKRKTYSGTYISSGTVWVFSDAVYKNNWLYL
jgi:hypothetical protein